VVYFVIGKIKRAFALQEEFEDTKGVIRSRKLKKDILCNGEKIKDKKGKNHDQ